MLISQICSLTPASKVTHRCPPAEKSEREKSVETVDSMEGKYESPFDSQGCIRTTNSGMNEGSDVTNVTKGKGRCSVGEDDKTRTTAL